MPTPSLNPAIIVLTCLTVLFISCSGCQKQSEPSKQQTIEVVTTNYLPPSKQKGWHKEESNPIIKAGDFVDKALWNDPHVMKEGKKYVMYMTTSSTKKPFKPPILPYRAVSQDGLKWKLDPAKPLMDASDTPFVSVETPSVIIHKGVYHMYYTGVYPKGGKTMFAVGHAASKDGLTWKKDPRELIKVTGHPTDWNGSIVGEPGAVVFKGKILVYFTAVGQLPGQTPSMDQSIGLVISTDGKNYSQPKRVLQLSKTYPKKDHYCGYSTPMAAVHDGKVHLFHDVVIFNQKLNPSWQQVALGHAVSSDGGVNFVQDKKTIFTRNDFDWTGGEIRSPSALFEKGKVRLWFAGMVPVSKFRSLIIRGIKGREFGIGHATIDADAFSNQ